MDTNLPERVDHLPVAENPMAILRAAVEHNIDAASIERLSALAERWQDRRAAQEFNEAMARFRADCPNILKSKTANISTKSGGSYSYTYTPLDAIASVVDPLLHRNGLSYSWDSTLEGGMMCVTCTLRHAAGHRESASFTCPTSSGNPGMSDQQKHASAMSYARRQSLTAILGLTTCDDDLDGIDPTTIADDQVLTIEARCAELDVNVESYLRVLGAASIPEIRANQFKQAVELLKQKEAALRAKAKGAK